MFKVPTRKHFMIYGEVERKKALPDKKKTKKQ